MEIKEIRQAKGLTQIEAATILGMQLRTYQNYEAKKSVRDVFKISSIKNILQSYEKITEDKGILSLEEITKIVNGICIKHDVEYVYLFGSYAKNTPREDSDVDLLISCKENGLAYIGLLDEFHSLLHKNIDLVKIEDLMVNLSFLNEILRTGMKIYERKEK